ncbi:hypothetical protein [Sphingobium sp. WCS2017Hpa-17]|uniref:hypothetical protein n=1 Tax=Sphingobium sp. WCS2017Hpa-17 TaxID=3073638 RepID=UPI00288BD04D|nr:hypothetical protein [Sphingobium sp. WCS2017Hpa-17]
MRYLLFLTAIVASPAFGQVAYPPADTSNLATKSEVQAASSAASAAQAAIPPACPVAPSGDTLNGTIGSGVNCTPKQDSTRPTSVQAGNTTLAANCTFSVSLARAFTSTSPFAYAAVVDTANNQMPCKIQTRSATAFTGICNAAQNTVLSLSVVTTGLTLLPFGTTCTAGTAVMWVAREPTQ